MKCRKLVYNSETKKQNIVWFGSYGKNEYYSFKEGNKNEVRIPKESLIITPDNETPFDFETICSSGTRMLVNCKLYKNDQQIGSSLAFTLLLEPNKKRTKKVRMRLSTLDFDYLECSGQIVPTSSSIISEVWAKPNSRKKAENYSEKGEGVRDSLIQRLSIIKGELWYKASYGLPLTEKIKNKGIYDSIILDIISSHPEVVRIENFESVIKDRKYQLNFEAYTTYNERIKISYLI